MPRKKVKAEVEEPKQFYTEKDVILDPTAPVVGGEFVTEEGDWRGQTVSVDSGIKLEDDIGTGEAVIIRTFEFGANPQVFKDYEKKNGHLPYAQEIFQSHMRGIMSMLWQDGLSPAEEIEPRLILSKKKDKYLIMVGAKPSLGNTILETPKTLSEIANEGRTHREQI